MRVDVSKNINYLTELENSHIRYTQAVVGPKTDNAHMRVDVFKNINCLTEVSPLENRR